jgi:hypothetical protein
LERFCGKKNAGYRSGLLRWVLRILVFLMVVFGGDNVVFCVADVVFKQSLFGCRKIRHVFVIFFYEQLQAG